MRYLKQHPLKSLLKNEQGFSLLELILVVGVLSSLSLGFIQITSQYVTEQQVIATTEHTKAVHEAAHQYVMNNFDDIYLNRLNGAAGAGDTFEIPIEDSGGLTHYLKNSDEYLPTNFNAVNPLHQTVTTLVHNVDGSGTVEIIVIGTGNRVNEDKVEAVAMAFGGAGGFWSAIDRDLDPVGDTSDDIIGAYGMWSVPVADLTIGTWPDGDAPTIAGGSYFATYQWLNYSDELGDYLYRATNPVMAEANTMMTNLDMNTFDLDGVDDITVGGTMTVSGGSQINGALNVAGVTSIAGGLSLTGAGTLAIVPDGASVATNLDVNDTLDIASGIVMQDDGNVATTNVLRSSTANVTNDVLNTTSVTADSANIDSLNTGAGTSVFSTNLSVENINVVGGRINADTISASSITVTGNADAQGVEGTGDLNVSGSTVVGGRTVLGTVDITNEFRCGFGC